MSLGSWRAHLGALQGWSENATVLNPEIPKELPDDKGAVLDIHVHLADG